MHYTPNHYKKYIADEAHAGDVVTAILADFRGLDTMGEMTVLAVAGIGVLAMQWRRPA
jgi:multicomponent Na+:H+ antiporter subunit A